MIRDICIRKNVGHLGIIASLQIYVPQWLGYRGEHTTATTTAATSSTSVVTEIAAAEAVAAPATSAFAETAATR